MFGRKDKGDLKNNNPNNEDRRKAFDETIEVM